MMSICCVIVCELTLITLFFHFLDILSEKRNGIKIGSASQRCDEKLLGGWGMAYKALNTIPKT